MVNAGYGPGKPCSVCGETIALSQVEYEVAAERERPIRFHLVLRQRSPSEGTGALRRCREPLAELVQFSAVHRLFLLELYEQSLGLAAIQTDVSTPLEDRALTREPALTHDDAVLGCGEVPLKGRAVHASQ